MAAPSLGPRLRVAQIWRGEVMEEKTFLTPSDVSLGGRHGVTFIIPDLGLPPAFNLLKMVPSGGYVLTLGEGMTGQLSIGGRTLTVTEFLSELREEAGSAGSFRAIPVKRGDWGVIHVDGAGDHTFFWNFVADEPPLPRGAGRDTELLLPAFLFAGILHAILLSLTWMFFDGPPNLVFASGDALTNYLVKRPDPKPIEEKKPDPEPQPGVEQAKEKEKPAATELAAGKVGGQGDKDRLRVKDAGDTAPHDPIHQKVMNKGLLPTLRNSEKFAKVTSGFDGLGDKMSRLHGDDNDGTPGSGHGSGTGMGDEANGTGTRTRGGTDGPGGGGAAHADIRTSEDINTGGTRPPKGNPNGKGLSEMKVQVDMGKPDGDFGGLTADQISKVVKSRTRSFQACFEAQLQRSPNLSGTIHVTWRINPDGTVAGARVKSSTMGNAAVESCLVRRVNELKFPAPGASETPVVNFPFVFAPRR